MPAPTVVGTLMGVVGKDEPADWPPPAVPWILVCPVVMKSGRMVRFRLPHKRNSIGWPAAAIVSLVIQKFPAQGT